MNKTNQFIIVVSVALIAIAIFYYFVYFLPSSQQESVLNSSIRNCSNDGERAVEKYKIEQGVNITISPEFHYNNNLNKCYAYVSVMLWKLCNSADIILDVYRGQEALTACYKNGGETTYGDLSVYPAQIINYTDYIVRKNKMLQL